MPFLFETLTSYQKAVLFADQMDQLVEAAKKNISSSMCDQLSRASLSISLNLAEGNGRWHKADKRQFYYVARGSVFECVPLINILRNRGAISEAEHKTHYDLLEELSKMISGLIKSTESQDPRKGAA